MLLLENLKMTKSSNLSSVFYYSEMVELLETLKSLFMSLKTDQILVFQFTPSSRLGLSLVLIGRLWRIQLMTGLEINEIEDFLIIILLRNSYKYYNPKKQVFIIYIIYITYIEPIYILYIWLVCFYINKIEWIL